MPDATDHPVGLTLLLAWHAAFSLASLTAYALDKRRAARAFPRTPERTLHTLDLLGGWPGGLLAMRLFKHKRRKAAFVRVFWLTVVGHLLVVVTAAWMLTP
jgi:uncharacterized membrane protein YsdA (DUF1294 family)